MGERHARTTKAATQGVSGELGLLPALGLETRKLRHKHLLLVAIGMLAMQLLWLAYVVLVHPSDGFTDYRILLFQIPLLNAVFLPLLSCVVSSTECDVETRGNMFKSLLTMQRAGALFWIKWLFSAGLMAAVVTLQTVVLTILAGAGGLDAIPAGELVVYWVSTFAVCVFCTSLAQALSLLTRSQFAPMVVGVALSFFGLFSMYFPESVTRLVPSAYFALLSTVEVSVQGKTVMYLSHPWPWGYLVALLAATAAVSVLAAHAFKRKEL